MTLISPRCGRKWRRGMCNRGAASRDGVEADARFRLKGCWLSGFSTVLRFSRARQLRSEAGAACPPHSEPHNSAWLLAGASTATRDAPRQQLRRRHRSNAGEAGCHTPHTVVALRERPVQRLVCSMRPAGARAAQGCASFRAWAPRALCWRWTMTTSLDRDVSEKCSFMRACVFCCTLT